jgi:Lrp/AsnC family transcriptional regulator
MLDDRDRRILDLIQADADMPLVEVAERVSLSVSACSRRIARLAEEGYVARKVAVLDRARMGLPTTVFVLVKTGHHAADWLDRFRAAVAAIPEIVEVHRLTGNVDYILKVVLPDVEHYDTVYKRLVQRIEAFDISAYISMETLKAETAIPTGFA